MADKIEWVYFKKNVNFNVGVRLNSRDTEGLMLTNSNPYVNIDKEKLRDFLQANKYHLQNGLIRETEEPVFDFVLDNSISDEEAAEIVKNVFILRKKLPNITSETILFKLYTEAKKQNRAKKILDMIEERIELVSPSALQQGVSWDNGEPKEVE